MEKFLQHYNKEYMKMAILKQEETFKQQVSELHRLYRVQKLLMRGDLKVVEEQDIEIENESDIELTLATGGRRRKRMKTTTDESSDSGAGSQSSSSTMSVSPTLKIHEWGLFQTPPPPPEKPSWHLQCLSLKMT
ncbi:hypothetical protein ZOSMA_86G00150 [Zostera marina]|uniref:Uncharacterized protein n=1 Tax=Zostera marina TaxID=29655 RepID=A0A0K9NN08_ZOSMR|nr:hypothetical protein ZOSMA_86G00150 [Zostera marina]